MKNFARIKNCLIHIKALFNYVFLTLIELQIISSLLHIEHFNYLIWSHFDDFRCTEMLCVNSDNDWYCQKCCSSIYSEYFNLIVVKLPSWIVLIMICLFINSSFETTFIYSVTGYHIPYISVLLLLSPFTCLGLMFLPTHRFYGCNYIAFKFFSRFIF